MSYLGEYRIDDFVMIVATTHQFASGAAFAPSAITYRVYENTTATEIVSDTAMTNFDSVTGLYMDFIQATAALGYEVGKTYTVLIKATVDSVSAITAQSFRILTAPANVTQIAGSAVSTSTAQLGVNVVNVGGTAQTARDLGNALPTAAPGASGGLPTVDSTNSVKIRTPIKRNTALADFTFAMYDTSGDLATGLTVTMTRSIDGASPAACANSVVEVSSGGGRYKIDLDASDLNGTEICFVATASGARDLSFTLHTAP